MFWFLQDMQSLICCNFSTFIWSALYKIVKVCVMCMCLRTELHITEKKEYWLIQSREKNRTNREPRISFGVANSKIMRLPPNLWDSWNCEPSEQSNFSLLAKRVGSASIPIFQCCKCFLLLGFQMYWIRFTQINLWKDERIEIGLNLHRNWKEKEKATSLSNKLNTLSIILSFWWFKDCNVLLISFRNYYGIW